MSFALWSIQRRREGKGMDPDAATPDQWPLIFSVLMMLAGLWGWLMTPTSAVLAA